MTIRVVVVICWSLGWVPLQFDVSSAYLNADLPRPKYVIPPPPWRKSSDGSSRLWKVHKAMNGFRDSGAYWAKHFATFLTEKSDLRFQRSWGDASLFVSSDTILILYVDDAFIFSSSLAKGQEARDKIFAEFDCREIPPREGRGALIFRFLGVDIHWGKDVIKFCQEDYSNKILEKFGMGNSRAVGSPCDKNWDQESSDREITVSKDNYRSFVGAILFLSNVTRPDLSFSVSLLCQAQDNPGNAHFVLAKRVLRYLSGSRDLGISTERDVGGKSLMGFADASWALLDRLAGV